MLSNPSLRRALSACVLGLALSGAAHAFEPLTIADQGTFMAGGTVKITPGSYNAPAPKAEGQTLHGDHAAVRYQIPENARGLPLVLLHGADQSSRTWETTADGREGFATMLLREGYGVYLLDQPRRGQAGNSTVPVELKAAPHDQFMFGQARLGLWPDKFPGSQFPDGEAALEQLFRSLTPDTGPRVDAVSANAVCAAINRIGPSVLVTHSAGSAPGWLAAMKTDGIRAIAAYEPAGGGWIFPEDEAPAPIENSGFWGALKPATVPMADFLKLTRIPIMIYYGDNIPSEPTAQPHQDYWRAAVQMAKLWAEAVNRHGGHVEVVQLPEKGLKGNTHFPMSDLNNREVEKLLVEWLHENQLDLRKTR